LFHEGISSNLSRYFQLRRFTVYVFTRHRALYFFPIYYGMLNSAASAFPQLATENLQYHFIDVFTKRNLFLLIFFTLYMASSASFIS